MRTRFGLFVFTVLATSCSVSTVSIQATGGASAIEDSTTSQVDGVEAAQVLQAATIVRAAPVDDVSPEVEVPDEGLTWEQVQQQPLLTTLPELCPTLFTTTSVPAGTTVRCTLVEGEDIVNSSSVSAGTSN